MDQLPVELQERIYAEGTQLYMRAEVLPELQLCWAKKTLDKVVHDIHEAAYDTYQCDCRQTDQDIIEDVAGFDGPPEDSWDVMAYGFAWEGATTPKVDLKDIQGLSLPIVREVQDQLRTMQHTQDHDALWEQ